MAKRKTSKSVEVLTHDVAARRNISTAEHEPVMKEAIMNGKALQEAAPDLPPDERASLARSLLLSLDEPPEAELTETWLPEAERRARETDRAEVQPVSAEEVRHKARALLRGHGRRR